MTTKNFASENQYRSKIINLKTVMTKETISKEIMTKEIMAKEIITKEIMAKEIMTREIIYSEHFPTEAPKFLHALYHMF